MSLSKEFTRREKMLLTILALLLVFAVYLYAVQQPVAEALDRLHAEQLEMEDALMLLQAKQLRLQAMRTELETVLTYSNPAEIPEYDNLQLLMIFLDDVMEVTTDYSLSFQPVHTEQDARVVRRVISMSFTCPSYPDARTVAERLRDSPFRCQVGDLSLAPVGMGEGAEIADVTAGPVQVLLTVTFFENICESP